MRALLRASCLTALGAAVAACSNDVVRFEDALVTNTGMTANQHEIIRQRGPVDQPFPGDIDQTTTASVAAGQSTAASSGIRVGNPPKVAPPTPLGSPTQLLASAKNKIKSTFSTPAASKPQVAAPRVSAANNPLVLAPRNTKPVALKIVGTDSMSTGSVTKPVQSAVSEAASAANTRAGGWGGAGGTWVSVKSGETLYNLSKRFGVPVAAIMSANNMTDANAIQVGQKVIIPAYTYSRTAAVSAPDANPETRASSASSGYVGQPKNGVLTVPKPRASYSAAPTPPPAKAPQVAVSGSNHVVASGDTLYGVARKYGTTVSAIRAANNMSSDAIRLGQRLVIPGSSSTVVAQAPANKIDPVTTGSVPSSPSKPLTSAKKIVKPAYTKPKDAVAAVTKGSKPTTVAKTGSDAFRWPIRGRVIHRFGDRVNGSTNDGIDISVPEGTPVKATENGTVIYSGSELADFGNLILVSHDDGWVSAYAHASQNKVKRGDKVTRGQVIAISGKSGNATTPKLHFELRKDSRPVDPLRHLSKY